MKNGTAIEQAIGLLATSLRLYAEAYYRYDGLFKVDREEAINNIDRAFEANLETFHTLYDVSKDLFQYFDFVDTALVIAIRNAIHHRDHPLFQSLNARFYLRDQTSRWEGASFLLSRHPTSQGGPILMTHFVRMDDVYARLDPGSGSHYMARLPKRDVAQKRFQHIQRDLGFDAIWRKSTAERYPADQVYIDLVPILISAVTRVFTAMRHANVEAQGYDAEVYMEHFSSGIVVDLHNPEFFVSKAIFGTLSVPTSS